MENNENAILEAGNPIEVDDDTLKTIMLIESLDDAPVTAYEKIAGINFSEFEKFVADSGLESNETAQEILAELKGRDYPVVPSMNMEMKYELDNRLLSLTFPKVEFFNIIHDELRKSDLGKDFDLIMDLTTRQLLMKYTNPARDKNMVRFVLFQIMKLWSMNTGDETFYEFRVNNVKLLSGGQEGDLNNPSIDDLFEEVGV
jgi:hypothetical protein